METIRLKKETYDKMNDLIRDQHNLIEDLEESKGIIIIKNDRYWFNERVTVVGKDVDKQVKDVFSDQHEKITSMRKNIEFDKNVVSKFKKSIWFKIYSFFNKG